MEKAQVLIPSPVLIDDSHQQQIHVLAVDDSLVDRKVIERLLKISSCKVTAVDSGWRALQYLGLDGEKNPAESNDLKVNLIITDYWMPGMTGYELLKKIKESSTFKEIPVVIMSSENVLPRINRCLEEGAEDFIVKPVKLSDVKRLKDNIKREEKRDDDDVHHHHHDHHHDDHHDQARGQKRKLNEIETQGHGDEDHHDGDDTLVSLPSSSPSSSPLDSRRQKTTNETV